MGDRQNGAVRGRGAGGRGRTRMRMDDPAFNSGKRKREEEGDPVLHLMSLVLRIGDRLRVSFRNQLCGQLRRAGEYSVSCVTDLRKTLGQLKKR